VSRARALARPALVTSVGLVCWLAPGAQASFSLWRGRLAMAPRYHESFHNLIAQIPDRKAVVFVRYAPNADVHLSLTNNEPDASAARVWAVHDLGDENLKLLQAAPDRTPYLYEELPNRHVLRPFPIPNEWAERLHRARGRALRRPRMSRLGFSRPAMVPTRARSGARDRIARDIPRSCARRQPTLR